MTDITKLKQEAEEARKAAIKEIRYTHTSDFYDPSAIADSLIAATIAQIALQAAEKEAEPNIDGQIISEIYKACELLGAKSDLLGTIGSWRDTMTDEHTLDTLKHLNEHYSNLTPIADDGWIKLEGGECPVKNLQTEIEVKFRNGRTNIDTASEWRWTDIGHEYDIIAYRIISPAADRVSES